MFATAAAGTSAIGCGVAIALPPPPIADTPTTAGECAGASSPNSLVA